MILGKDDDIMFTINDFFSNAVSTLNIPQYLAVDMDQFEDPVLRANEKYKKSY